MPIYHSTYLLNRFRNAGTNERVKMFSAADTPMSTTFDVFLSHSFLDREIVKGLYLELTEMGFSVYVDWIVDDDLDRNNVTKDSAEKIRKRMKASKTLLLAISVNAKISKWMPWELGFMDGDKGLCAVIPVSDASREVSYKGYEYLKLYPHIKKISTTQGEELLWVIESAYRYRILQEWIAGGAFYSRNVNIDPL